MRHAPFGPFGSSRMWTGAGGACVWLVSASPHPDRDCFWPVSGLPVLLVSGLQLGRYDLFLACFWLVYTETRLCLLVSGPAPRNNPGSLLACVWLFLEAYLFLTDTEKRLRWVYGARHNGRNSQRPDRDTARSIPETAGAAGAPDFPLTLLPGFSLMYRLPIWTGEIPLSPLLASTCVTSPQVCF